MIGFGGQRGMQGDDIAPPENLLGGDVFYVVLQRPFGIRERIIGQDFHAEPSQDLPRDAADLTRADDPRRLFIKVESHQPLQREIHLANPVEGPVDLPIQGQDKRHRMLRNRMGRVTRDPGDGDPQLPGGFDIHVVEAGTAQRHHPHPVPEQIFQRRTPDAVVDKHANCLGPLGGKRCSGLQTKIVKLQIQLIDARGGLQVIAVVGLGIVNGHEGLASVHKGKQISKLPGGWQEQSSRPGPENLVAGRPINRLRATSEIRLEAAGERTAQTVAGRLLTAKAGDDIRLLARLFRLGVETAPHDRKGPY